MLAVVSILIFGGLCNRLSMLLRVWLQLPALQAQLVPELLKPNKGCYPS